MFGRLIAFVVAVGMAALLYQAARPVPERPLAFEPGVYRGDKPPKLTADQTRDLQSRGNLLR